ncbi:DUF3168 domain-containing protein [Emcibacter nanhaiensis]|uniref:DUF3168 domain-containing protein n=1 Tax=Emcibacter nanhaiensis TaxID=1505037 RepID=A0A501PBZ8_9PROT|nr:DUF3168 domain-containing protein [Emcibacter nanhaiensis]TPD57745.1 DUF3168 domain-containing protein [Emcibacter nanhaiensis]
MTLTALNLLQASLHELLSGNVELAGRLSGIFDHVPEGMSLPYLAIGDMSVRDWSSKSFTGLEVLFDLHLWSGHRGNLEIRELADLVHGLLTPEVLQRDGLQVASLQFIFFETFFETDGRIRHGVMRYRARIIPGE